MATITLRLDDAVKEKLESVARARGQNLSDLIRAVVNDLVLPEPQNDWRYEAHVPVSLTVVERQQLALLHRILARVLPEDANGSDGDLSYQLERARVLEKGFVQQYPTEFGSIEPELPARDCEFVMDVLDMFRRITFSKQELKRNDIEIPENLVFDLTFHGFDGNDSRESKLLAFARYLVRDDRWTELHSTFSDDNDNGNSHMPCAATYARMLTALKELPVQTTSMRGFREQYLLDVDGLRHVADARVHPSNRSSG